MEYFTYEMDVFKFERISHYDLYFKPSVPPMPDFFPIRCGAHFFLGSFIRCLARAERLCLQEVITGGALRICHIIQIQSLPKNLQRKYMT